MMTTARQHPYHPIIYVRGFAATQGEIEETVADPYMGFNIGSTKARVAWTGDVKRFYFESPLVRLMSDHEYEDVFVDGDDLVAAERADHPVPYRCIIIYRYYDEASKDFGDGKTPPIEHFAKGLGELILRLREKICANKDNKMRPAGLPRAPRGPLHGRTGLPRLPAESEARLGGGARRGGQVLHLRHAAQRHRHAHRA